MKINVQALFNICKNTVRKMIFKELVAIRLNVLHSDKIGQRLAAVCVLPAML